MRPLERPTASVETVHRAGEIRTLAERQMGAFLKDMPKHDGGRPVKTGADAEPVTAPATLAEIGITKKQSSSAAKTHGHPCAPVSWCQNFRDALGIAERFRAEPMRAKRGGVRRVPTS